MATREKKKGAATNKVVVVTGDVTMDWHLTHSQVIKSDQFNQEEWQNRQEWETKTTTRLFWERGGAARTADLIELMGQKNVPPFKVYKVKAPEKRGDVSPAEHYHHSYAIWGYLKPDDKEGRAPSKGVWRVSKFLGLEHKRVIPTSDPQGWPGKKGEDISLVVLDDADLGFRDCDLAPWLDPLKDRQDVWILLKIMHPVAEGKLWDYLYNNHANRLIVVIPVNDLRRTEVRISSQLSWERTAQDLLWELTYNTKINLLRNCAHVVVSFESAGAFWYAGPGAGPLSGQKVLFFDPQRMEGVWGRDHKGGMIGFTTCLVASIAYQIQKNIVNPDISSGIQLGLAAMRSLYVDGYQGEAPDKLEALEFPLKNVANILRQEDFVFLKEKRLPSVEVKMPVSFRTKKGLWESSTETDFWCILRDKYQKQLSQTAHDVVLLGPKGALKEVPIGEFGELVTVDRQEIESFRSIRNLMREYYCRSLRPDQAKLKPLSFAVFGPPGSGKSFGIIEVAKSLLPQRIQEIEFNLSQFKKPEELLGAFHQVRDLGLKGKMPLVFWDEFDTKVGDQSWFWLRYFLAPMQDGTFQEGQITHPLGRAIFVFAGGTSSTMESFANPKLQHYHSFKEAKGPDFVSRIKAHVDMRGPNRPEVQEGMPWAPDPFFIIRRAIMFQVLLKRHWPKIFRSEGGIEKPRIDDGVLRAFLEVDEYRHGVRSMETIIATSLLHDETSFKRSLLPPEEQLDLHVDAANFLDLVHHLDKDTVEKLATVNHEIYINTTPGSQLPHNYEDLDEDSKEKNRNLARNIAILLAQVGLMIVPDGPGLKKVSLALYLERLAKNEHQRWLKERVDEGWHYGPKRDDIRKIHPLLLPWHKLTEPEVEKWPKRMVAAIGRNNLLSRDLPPEAKEGNRRLVAGFEEVLEAARFVITKRGLEEKDLRIGITGHCIVMEEEKIKAGITEAVRRIEESFPGRSLTVLTSLAEGASQVAAQQLLENHGAGLHAILPFEWNVCLKKDFNNNKEAGAEFVRLLKKAQKCEAMRHYSSDNEAYEAAGLKILKECDILMAIWDGNEAQGLGGTGEIALKAQRQELPFIWVHAGNRDPKTNKPTTLGAQQGMVTIMNFPP